MVLAATGSKPAFGSTDGVHMDGKSKLYGLYAELTLLKSDIHAFEARRPNPNKWKPKEADQYDQLIKRRDGIRAEIAHLGGLRPHRQR